MSHFTVLVIGLAIEKQLQPFHEYECTGIKDEYVKFVPTDLEAAKKDFEEWGDEGDSFEDYLHANYEYDEDQKIFGRLTNENAQWDWWILGGRWTGFFKLKPDTFGGVGKPGLMTKPAEKGRADSALKRDIDFEGMRDDAEKKAAEVYDLVHEAIKGTPEAEKWETIMERIEDRDEAREYYNSQLRVKAFKTVGDKVGFFASVDEFEMPREQYLQNARNSAISTYAMVKDSQWYQKGEMGWWGASSGEMPQGEWDKKLNEMIDSVPDDTLLSIVDCHI